MKKYTVLVGSIILFLFMGLIYAWSIFVSPLEAEFGWLRDQTSLTFTICMISFCFGTLAVAPLLKRVRPTFIIMAAGALILAGFLLSSTVASLWQLYVYYGVVCGFAIGCAYNTLLSVVPLWFPKHVGAVNGIVLLSYGVGSLVLGSVSTSLINAMGWRSTFTTLSIAAILIFCVLSLLITRPRETLPGSTAAMAGSAGEVNTGRMLRRADFWLFFLWLTMLQAVGLAVVGHAASIAEDIHMVATLIPLAVGVVSVSSGLGRVVSGLLYDRIGVIKTLVLETVWAMAGCVLLILSTPLASNPLLFVGFVFIGLAFGSNPALNATFTRGRFGSKFFSTNFAISGFSLIPSAFIGSFLAGILRAASGNYISSFIVMAAYLVVALVLALLLRKSLAARVSPLSGTDESLGEESRPDEVLSAT